ncbi:MAG: DinB family protein [Agriterribacter sp.]
MEPVNKQAFLNRLYQRVENHLYQAIHVFQNMSEQSLLMAPATGGWSIAQCLQHLNEYGNYYLPVIEQAINKHSDTANPNFKSSWLGSYFTKMMEPETGKKKMKAFKKYDPPRQLNAYTVVAEFIQQQEQLLLLLYKASSADLNKRIPISLTPLIRLKLGDVFQFVIAHNERHVQQAKKLL